MFDVKHQWIHLNELYKLTESFFQISNSFSNFRPKTIFLKKNTDAWIIIKLQCVIYQWICLNELYKLMKKTFFKYQISFRNFDLKLKVLTENWKIFKQIERLEYWSKWNVLYINGFDSTSSTNECEAFFKFLNHFSN